MTRWIPLCGLANLIILLAPAPAWSQGFLQRLQEQLRSAEPTARATQPESSAGYLGVVGDNAPDAKGVLVATVRPGSPAAETGLQSGDRIVAINGSFVRDVEEMGQVLEKARVGERVGITVDRRGQRKVYGVTLSLRPAEQAPAASVVPASAAEPVSEPDRGDGVEIASLGVVVGRVTDDVAQRLPPTTQRGALIQAIRPGSPADQFGLPLNGVIVSIDGRRIDQPADLATATAGARPGDLVELAYYDGEQLQRKRVRLVPAGAPAGDPRRAGATPLEAALGEGGRRPALGRIGRLLDQLAEPQPGTPQPTLPPSGTPLPPVPARDVLAPESASDSTHMERLQRQVDSLQRQLERMQKRLTELEARVGQGNSRIPPPPPEPGDDK